MLDITEVCAPSTVIRSSFSTYTGASFSSSLQETIVVTVNNKDKR